MTSTSMSGSSTPSASTPSCQCWRYRPFWARSYRKFGATYQTFHGGVGRCCTYARTTDAVPSGRRPRRRPPLSVSSYISLATTSVCSPTRWKTSMCSNIGVIARPYP